MMSASADRVGKLLERLAAGDETALGSLKTQLKGGGVVLRSKTPDGVIQEIWALLCAYHAVRDLTAAAAALARQDPLRICFANSSHQVIREGIATLAEVCRREFGVPSRIANVERRARV